MRTTVSRSSRFAVLLPVLLAAVISCQKPDRGSEFIKGERAAYEFVLEDVDSLALYDISLYTSPKTRNIIAPASLPLEIRWVSEESDIYVERVVMEVSSRRQPYREGVLFPLGGRWRLVIYLQDGADAINGLGITWRRYGTR